MEHITAALTYIKTVYKDGEIGDAAYFDALYILNFALLNASPE